MSTPNPVGYHCDHSDEPSDQRTHHNWEFVEDEGFVFTHQPDTISAHGGTQDYLKPEQRDRRCPRAVPVYAVDVPALLAEIDRLRGRVAELERPAVEAKRAKIRQSYTELAAQAEQDGDHEGAAEVRSCLGVREEQWQREDAERGGSR